jgi:hypothetical protein
VTQEREVEERVASGDAITFLLLADDGASSTLRLVETMGFEPTTPCLQRRTAETPS